MRAIFFGMPGAFSLAALDALLAAGRQVDAVVVPARRDAPFALRRADAPAPAGTIPLAGPGRAADIVARAWERGLPVLELARERAAEAREGLAALRPDVVCVACWPRRIPAELLALPPLGFLNVHPSLLPAFRGPEPLFWIFRSGAPAGVTVHFMDEGLDSGPIAAQEPVELPDGISGPEAEARCAGVGGRLLAEALRRLEAGALERRPQPPGGSAYGPPGPDDFTLDTGWPARRAFNFMRGTAEWGEPYPVVAGGERLLLIEALAFDPAAELGAPAVRSGEIARVQFAPGVLTALAAKAPAG
ncbi:MAG: formyltransferase family protein [Chloroflexota bacterium]